MKDGFNRNIDYLRISITDLCNLRCQYCMPPQGIPKKLHKEIMSYEEIICIVKEAARLGVKKIRLTGGEPLIRKGVVSFISRLSAIEGIEDIAMTTNGLLLAPLANQLRDAGLKRVNISLDSLDPLIYSQLTGGGDVNKVLKAIDKALEVGMKPIKINVVVVGGINDHEVEQFAALTIDKDIYVRFIELMPIGAASGWSRERFISNDDIKGRLKGIIREITQDHTGPAKYYKYPDAKGKIGFISAISSHFCSDCNRIRLTSDGKIKPCLHSSREIDLREVVNNNPQNLSQTLQEAILSKPKRHYLNTSLEEQNNRDMFEIGG